MKQKKSALIELRQRERVRLTQKGRRKERRLSGGGKISGSEQARNARSFQRKGRRIKVLKRERGIRVLGVGGGRNRGSEKRTYKGSEEQSKWGFSDIRVFKIGF